MPNVAQALRLEITRVCAKAIREAVDPLRSTIHIQRREIATLKKRVAAVEREATNLRKQVPTPPDVAVDDGSTLRFRADGLKSLRARLGLSAATFGALLNVSDQTIYNWESGTRTPGREQLVQIAALRKLGKRAVARRLSATVGNES